MTNNRQTNGIFHVRTWGALNAIVLMFNLIKYLDLICFNLKSYLVNLVIAKYSGGKLILETEHDNRETSLASPDWFFHNLLILRNHL